MAHEGEFCDLEVVKLTRQQIEQLRAHATDDWLSSYQFCVLAADSPAQRVAMWLDAEGVITRAVYYAERTWLGVFRRLTIYGPVALDVAGIHKLLAQRKAHRASIVHMTASDAARFPGTWRDRGVMSQSQDVVIELPATVEDYLRSLGSKTRTQLPYYVRRLNREMAGHVEIIHRCKRDVSRDTLSELVALNRARIENKGHRHAWSGPLIERHWLLARECGFLCSVRLHERLAGGTLTYIHGDDAYGFLIGHDPRYDKLRLGTVCQWLTIQYLIDRGIKRYHLLWGKSAYKFQFGGKEHVLCEVNIFRGLVPASAWQVERVKHYLLSSTFRVAHPTLRSVYRRLPPWVRRYYARVIG